MVHSCAKMDPSKIGVAMCRLTEQRAGRMMDFGQLLHGCVGMLREHYGDCWLEHVAVLNPAVIEKLDLLTLQRYPDVMVIPLRPGIVLSTF